MSDDFDIEKFPTSPSAVRMMSRISPIYEKSYVGKWIFQVMGLEVDDVRLRYAELKDQAFPETATWGLPYWEQRYAITPTAGQTIEERRRAILTKRNTREPFNPAKVEQIIQTMTGCTAHVTEDVAPYTFKVEIIPGGSDFDFDAVFQKLRRIKPSHQRMVMYLSAGVAIRVAPTRTVHKFPYRLAGTYPQTNTPGGYTGVIVENETAGTAHKFTYPETGEHEAGTLPQENIVAAVRPVDIQDAADGAAYAFQYPETGEATAGTIPQENINATITTPGVVASADASSASFHYPLCGDSDD